MSSVKINSKYIINLNAKLKAIKFVEDNIRTKSSQSLLRELFLLRELLDMTLIG